MRVALTQALLVLIRLRAELLEATRSDVGFCLLILLLERVDVSLSNSQLRRFRLVQEVPVRAQEQDGADSNPGPHLLALGHVSADCYVNAPPRLRVERS